MTDKPKQAPRGVVAMGLSLPLTDKRARDASRRATLAAWLAAAALLLSSGALLAAAWAPRAGMTAAPPVAAEAEGGR